MFWEGTLQVDYTYIISALFPSSTWELGWCRDGQSRRRNCQWRSLAWRVQNKVREMRSTFTGGWGGGKKKQKKNAAKICSVLGVVARRLKGHVLWLKIVGRTSLLPWFSFIVVNLGAGLQFHSTTKNTSSSRETSGAFVGVVGTRRQCVYTHLDTTWPTVCRVNAFCENDVREGDRLPTRHWKPITLWLFFYVLFSLHLQTWEQNPKIFLRILMVVRNWLVS